jgi:hypothetical protein
MSTREPTFTDKMEEFSEPQPQSGTTPIPA